LGSSFHVIIGTEIVQVWLGGGHEKPLKVSTGETCSPENGSLL
jgi:hypothetical protein